MIVVENLNRWYKSNNQKQNILQDISFRIEQGEFVILKGVSGSGKTTLLSILAGIEKPSSGKVVVDGNYIAKLPDIHISSFRSKTIGMVFQHFNLIDSLTVLDNAIAPLAVSSIGLKEALKLANNALKRVNIAHKANAYPSELSGGEKQRAAIARAIVANPPLLLCDEPTANLDRENSLLFIDILKELNKDGKTVVVATHDPIFESLDIPCRVINIENGKVA